jgi:S1-C subfamily serine protease
MNRTIVLLFAWLPFTLALVPFPAGSAAEDPPHPKPWFVDDETFFDAFIDSLTDLAKDGKCMDKDRLEKKMKSGEKARVRLTKSCDKVLTPTEVYKAALPSVFIIGSVFKDKDNDGGWKDGSYATAWAASADGVLVTNWHVFDELKDGEAFGAVDHLGKVYPVTDFLGGDKVADVAVVRIDARGLKPLPVSDRFADVGSWVGVLGHPGDNYFVFTQGNVTRYSTNKNDDGKKEKWMGLTAEYAGGSSGSPVLDKYGAVVGMAALTLTIDGGPSVPAPNRRNLLLGQRLAKAPPAQEKPDQKDPPKPEQMPGAGSSVQMILKMAVPGPVIHKLFVKMIED